MDFTNYFKGFGFNYKVDQDKKINRRQNFVFQKNSFVFKCCCCLSNDLKHVCAYVEERKHLPGGLEWSVDDIFTEACYIAGTITYII